MFETAPKLATKATILLTIFFVFLFGCKDRNVDPHLLTDDGAIIYFKPNPNYPQHPGVPKFYQDNVAAIPRFPACDSLPVEHLNFKVSIHKASPSESPLFQNCSIVKDPYGDFNIGKGSKVVVDVSYYKNIKEVKIPVGPWGYSSNIKSSKAAYVILKDFEGNIMASDSVKTNDGKVLYFRNNLEKLKEVIVINCNSDYVSLDYIGLSNKCCE